jgi:hypothetical protein
LHDPPLHVPGDEYTSRVVLFEHVAAGGELHDTPAHGSARHAEPLQPKGQLVSLNV